MFQVPNLKVLGFSFTGGADSGPASPCVTLVRPPDAGLWRGEEGGGGRLVVGALCAPGDAQRRRFSHSWLLGAPEASPRSGGVPAVLPPSPSVPIRLSGVPTACAGRVEASLNIEVSNCVGGARLDSRGYAPVGVEQGLPGGALGLASKGQCRKGRGRGVQENILLGSRILDGLGEAGGVRQHTQSTRGYSHNNSGHTNGGRIQGSRVRGSRYHCMLWKGGMSI